MWNGCKLYYGTFNDDDNDTVNNSSFTIRITIHKLVLSLQVLNKQNDLKRFLRFYANCMIGFINHRSKYSDTY